MIEILNHAADNLCSEGWDKEAAAVRKAADEIERLREALALADAALSGANMNMKVVEKKIRAALAKEKTDD